MHQPPDSHDHRCSTPTVNAAAANAAGAADDDRCQPAFIPHPG
ncbi:MAG: hypothetical protein V3V55_02620 [Rhodospirillales bacterium]